jgi:hypothetical protein
LNKKKDLLFYERVKNIRIEKQKLSESFDDNASQNFIESSVGERIFEESSKRIFMLLPFQASISFYFQRISMKLQTKPFFIFCINSHDEFGENIYGNSEKHCRGKSMAIIINALSILKLNLIDRQSLNNHKFMDFFNANSIEMKIFQSVFFLFAKPLIRVQRQHKNV